MHSYDVFVVADLCIDLLFTGKVRPRYGQAEQFLEDYTIDLGGSAAIFAAQFVKLGGNVGLLGKVGDDFFGHFLIEKLEKLGISSTHISLDSNRKTAIGVGLSDGTDRAMLTYAGTLHSIEPQDIQKDFATTTKHWHIASYFLLENLWDHWIPFLQQLRQQGGTVSLDTNWAPKENWDRVHALLPLVDVFLPNEEEAKLISGKADVLEAGSWLASYCKIVVIKRGGAGAMVFNQGQIRQFDLPKTWTNKLLIADTTGAGDNFDAGFLRSWLLGKPIEDCVQLGMKCGTVSLSAIGGIAAQLKEIIR